MRTKKFIYNTFMAALFQIINLLIGFILPRLYIETYGSEVNGLVTTITQLVSYFLYVEAGIGAALIHALYKPLANNNQNEVNKLVSLAKKSYIRASGYCLILVILLSVIYPFIIQPKNIETYTIVILVIVIGLFGVLDFYTIAKYRVLLTADQRYYIVLLASIITTLINFVISVYLINNFADIVLVKAFPLLTFILRSMILQIYIKKLYPNINYEIKIKKDLMMTNRWDALIFQIGVTFNLSFPLIIVSVLVSLEQASVFSIYSMVFTGVIGLISIFTVGSSASMGDIVARGEISKLKIINNQYEFSIYTISAFFFSVTMILIIPFIKLYTRDITDVNYVNGLYGILFVLWGILFTARLPQNAIINGTGIFKATRMLSISQITILTILTIFLANFYQITGVLIAMVLSSLYYFIGLLIVVKRNVINIILTKTFSRLIRIIIITIIAYAPFIVTFNINIDNLNSFFLEVIKVSVWCAFVTITINLIFDRHTFKDICNKFKKLIFP